jgi:hypothetical protein
MTLQRMGPVVQNQITASSAGELQLRVNDCDSGLSDTSGSLLVKISPTE